MSYPKNKKKAGANASALSFEEQLKKNQSYSSGKKKKDETNKVKTFEEQLKANQDFVGYKPEEYKPIPVLQKVEDVKSPVKKVDYKTIPTLGMSETSQIPTYGNYKVEMPKTSDLDSLSYVNNLFKHNDLPTAEEFQAYMQESAKKKQLGLGYYSDEEIEQMYKDAQANASKYNGLERLLNSNAQKAQNKYQELYNERESRKLNNNYQTMLDRGAYNEVVELGRAGAGLNLKYSPENVQAYNSAKEALKAKGYTDEEIAILSASDLDGLVARGESEREQKAYANEHPVLSSIASVGTNMLKPADLLGQGMAYLEGRPIKSEDYVLNNLTNTMREGASEDMGDVGKFFYNTGMGIVDSLASRAVAGSVSPFTMAAGSAEGATQEALERGASPTDAFATGLASGATEAVFEKLELDKLNAFKQAPGVGVKNFLGNVGKQMVNEGVSEGATELTNTLTDYFINGDNSAFATSVDAYEAQGLSHDEAMDRAIEDVAKNVGLNTLGGMLSGGAMGAGYQMAGNFSNPGSLNPFEGQNKAIKEINLTEQVSTDTDPVSAVSSEAPSLSNNSVPVLKKIVNEQQNNPTSLNPFEAQKKAYDANVANGNEVVRNPSLLQNVKERANAFLSKALWGKGKTDEPHNQIRLSSIPDTVADYVSNASGGKLNIGGKYFALEGGKLKHEIEKHSDPVIEASRDQIALNANDISNIVETMYQPDIVEYISSGLKSNQRESFALIKADEGYIVVVENVGGKQNPNIVAEEILHLTNRKMEQFLSGEKSIADILYENSKRKGDVKSNNEDKKNRVTVAHDALNNEPSAYTSETSPHSPLSTDSIPDLRKTVNRTVQNTQNGLEPLAYQKQPDYKVMSEDAGLNNTTSSPENLGLNTSKQGASITSENLTREDTGKIAQILDTETKTDSDRGKRFWAIAKANILDKGAVFEDLSLKTKNRELMGKWDYTLTSESRAQNLIGKGAEGVKSLYDIQSEVDNTGLAHEFTEYMYHMHNVDRMNLDKRYSTDKKKVENKPVFGDSVTSEQSQKIAKEYEAKHPEFKDFAKDVYAYNNYLRKQLVDKGVISQETADLWNEMYPHYVPVRRVDTKGNSINVPLDTNRTGVNAPVKKATGGNSDILPLFDTMALRTLQTYKATAKNSFGVELKNTLNSVVEKNSTSVDDAIDTIDSQEQLLQDGKNGKNPTFTVFENGERVTFEITKDMYDAIKPTSEAMATTLKVPNAINNIRRGLLTEYNPVFMLTNPIKDVQDILINSQHPAKTYAKIPEATKQLATKGYWYQEYVANGGQQNTYFDKESKSFGEDKKGVENLPFIRNISALNNTIEMAPRLAEYIASREQGRSVEVSMLDAARVTTNFKAGGDFTKFLNRNGFTFLNASVQGAVQQARNLREANANGLKGWANLATKFAVAEIPALILNGLIWKDDEEYEELSDYVKQNYYVVWKFKDGTFLRFPKGRTVAVIQEAFNQMGNAITGDDEVDLNSFLDLVINNIAPSNPLENNILSPIVQAATNKTWYGDDLVPERLADLPEAEQYDESTDMLSRGIGKALNVSPVKVNYLLDQYSGGIGDVALPMLTPEAKSDADSFGDYLLAPLKNKFTTDSVMNNQNVSDIYSLSEKLIPLSKKTNATDEDILQNKYINSVKSEMSDLYKLKREIQSSDLSKSEKYSQSRDVQRQINELAKTGINSYKNISIDGDTATVNDVIYSRDDENEWRKSKYASDLIPVLKKMDKSEAEIGNYLQQNVSNPAKGATQAYDKYGDKGFYWYYLCKLEADANNNGSVAQKELEAYLKSSTMSREQKYYYWNLFCPDAKKKPVF